MCPGILLAESVAFTVPLFVLAYALGLAGMLQALLQRMAVLGDAVRQGMVTLA